MLVLWLQFLALASVIGFCGFNLSLLADQISAKTKLGRSLTGLILLSTVTSLPELVIGFSSVVFKNNPDLALGDILGSCTFNLVLLVYLDFSYKKGTVFDRRTQGHLISGVLGIILLGVVGLALVLKDEPWLQLGANSICSFVIPFIYYLSLKEIFAIEKEMVKSEESSPNSRPLSLDIFWFVINSSFVLGAGALIPAVAENIMHTLGWNAAFMGTLFIAFTTSLPEISVTISALRINAAEMAFSNLLGSNLFNLVILAIDDFFYKEGSIFKAGSPSHSMTVLATIMMTGVALVALLKPPQKKFFNTISMLSFLLLGIYLMNVYVSYKGSD